MKRLLLALVAVCIAAPAAAITYEFNFSLGSSGPSGFYDNLDTPSFEQGDIAVTGRVTTDGTIGAIDETNIVSWNFEFAGELESLEFSSDGLLGDDVPSSIAEVEGNFDATPTLLSLTGPYKFVENGTYVAPDPAQPLGFDTLGIAFGELAFDEIGIVSGVFQSARCLQVADVCQPEDSIIFGEFASEQREPLIGVAISTVPLPASALFLLAGLGGLAAIRRV